MFQRGRGAIACLTAFAASALGCQAVLGVGDYAFEPALEQGPSLSDAADASAGLDASSGEAVPGVSSAAELPPTPDAGLALACSDPGCEPTACSGCVVGARCVPRGQTLPSNPCLLCDPLQSASGYSIAFGASCGAGTSACSEPDTCDADGACAPNDLPRGTACAAAADACDAADTCDGLGACVDRRADDGTTCEDGLFCTTGDQCQAGQCASGTPLGCGENQQCVEGARACQCAGCQVDGVCFPPGASDGRVCFVCDPQRNTAALSPNEGALCGPSEGECFDARACNASGDCTSRPLPPGTACGSPFGSDCSSPDSCNGAGFCNPNDLDGTLCDDGSVCTIGDSCQGGACFPGSAVSCDNGQACNELNGCACPSGLEECVDGSCRRFCGDFEQP